MNKEILERLKDPKFYLENFVKIKGKIPGLIPFILKEAQKDLFNTMKRYSRIMILKSRQMGFSTAVTGYLYHDTIMTPGTTTALIGYNSELTADLLDKVKTFYRSTPDELKPTIHYNSKYEISFPKINSKILVLPSTENVGRGYCLHNVLATELSSWEKAEEKMETLEASVPIDGKLIIESTPKGSANLYHRMWMSEDNGYEKKKYGWWWGYSFDEINLIRKRMNNPMKFAQEYGCFLAGSDVITADGVKNIEDIKVGDRVLSHSNRYRKVIRTMKREYIGDIYTISSFGNNKPIMCTSEHPIRTCNDGKNNKWIEACKLIKGDMITFCKPLLGKNKSISEDLVRIIGWYICEGSCTNNIVNFALSSKETDNINQLINSLKKVLQKQVKIKIRKGTGKGINIDVNNRELGEFLISFCGSGAKNKKIPFSLISGYEKLLYDTLIKGDGCNVSIKRYYEKDQYVTISKTLAYQLQLLSHSLGYRASISMKKGGYKYLFNKNIASLVQDKYEIRIFKYNPFPNTKRYKRNSIRVHKYNVVSKIRNIERDFQKIEVYNLEVTIDNSYTVNGRVVHNCEFLTSGRSVFDHNVIKEQRKNILKVGDTAHGAKHKVYEEDGWVIYRKPDRDGIYVCGVDVSEGVEGGDYSVAVIWDRKTGEEVAMYRILIAPDLLANKIDKMGRRYNNALMVVEINNHGLTTLIALKQLVYPTLYFRPTKFETIGTKYSDKLGWKTTKITRPLLIDEFAQALRDGELIIHSKKLIDEMTVFVYDDNGNMVPQSTFKDDCIFAAGIGYQGFKIVYSGKLDQLDYTNHLPVNFAY